MSALFRFLRIACHDACQFVRVLFVGQEHARIAFQVYFGDEDTGAVVGRGDCRKNHQSAFVLLGQFRSNVCILKGVHVLGIEIPVFTSVGIGNHGVYVRRELVSNFLFLDGERLLSVIHETISNTVVVGTELHFPLFLEGECQLVVVVNHLTSLVERGRNGGVGAFPAALCQFGVVTPDFSVAQSHGKGRRCQYFFAIQTYLVG